MATAATSAAPFPLPSWESESLNWNNEEMAYFKSNQMYFIQKS